MKNMPALLAFGTLLLTAPSPAPADERPGFGGNGTAWQEKTIGGDAYWDHTRKDNLSKDWETPEGERRFTQPGRAEGRADEHSAIESYPCPGTQVYPKGDAGR